MLISVASFAVFFVSLAIPYGAAFGSGIDGGFDHRAHSVPGGPYSAPDNDGDGFAFVNVNGELSHSHYFNAETGVTGKIVKFIWTVSGKQVCNRMICSIKFPLGRTTLNLLVVDNTGYSASATTAVNVYSGAKPGVRMWFYPGNGWIPNMRSQGILAQYSTTPRRIKLTSKNAFPQFILQKKFSIRTLGAIDFFQRGNYVFRFDCGGAACVFWIGQKMILSGSNKLIQSRPMILSKATRSFEIVYRRQSPRGPAPKLVLWWKVPRSKGFSIVPEQRLFHNPALYYPVVHSVTPKKAAVGSQITVTGSSFMNVKAVKVGNQFCASSVTKNQFTVTCLVPSRTGPTTLCVVTNAGTSNKVSFDIVDGREDSSGSSGASLGQKPVGYYQPISFAQTFLQKSGKVWTASQLTAITLGPDGRYYIGSLQGVVHIVTTNFGNGITDHCKSPKVGNSRSILGLAFNPAETGVLRLYASTSVLHWDVKKLLPYNKGWHNGEVIAMQKTKAACIARVATIISGLPVSNYDHAVNGISFDHHGNLLVTVGSGTNAGVSKPGDALGGVPDSPLSGAMLQAPVRKKGFNGTITYSNYNNPATANKIKGDVLVFAAGLRNSMCHVAHSNGHIYATDNGANAQFGARSTGCNSQGRISPEPDTLKKLKRGGFFGFANRNRGRNDGRQCVHRPPQMNLAGYHRHIATFQSSTNGLIEYTANTFGGQMRGDLLATKFAVSGSGRVYRVQLNGRGSFKSSLELTQFSGLTAAMSPTGGIVMPRVYQNKVAVLLPNENNPGLMVVTSVNPFRGPKIGGNTITVTGWNLKPPLSVKVGGKACTKVRNFKKGRSFTCTVPSGSGRAPLVVKRGDRWSKSFGYEYMYLN